MPEVSREPAALRHAGVVDLVDPPALAGDAPGVCDLLRCDCLGDAGLHGLSLSIESCFSTAIRMN
jgi:hypothetical protein